MLSSGGAVVEMPVCAETIIMLMRCLRNRIKLVQKLKLSDYRHMLQ